MAVSSFSRRPLAARSLHGATLLLVALTGCGDKAEPDAAPGLAAAGSSAAGGAAGGAGGSPSGAGAVASLGGTGALPASTAGAGNQAGRASAAGTGGGSATSGASGGGRPSPGDDGASPYERECHGDTVMCEDVEALRCLGIRYDTTVYGYSCSNACETDADCSDAPASGEATAGCVDFVTQKHCLLVCLSDGKTRSCPDGMSCYVYPQSPIGYCLWQ